MGRTFGAHQGTFNVAHECYWDNYLGIQAVALSWQSPEHPMILHHCCFCICTYQRCTEREITMIRWSHSPVWTTLSSHTQGSWKCNWTKNILSYLNPPHKPLNVIVFCSGFTCSTSTWIQVTHKCTAMCCSGLPVTLSLTWRTTVHTSIVPLCSPY